MHFRVYMYTENWQSCLLVKIITPPERVNFRNKNKHYKQLYKLFRISIYIFEIFLKLSIIFEKIL